MKTSTVFWVAGIVVAGMYLYRRANRQHFRDGTTVDTLQDGHVVTRADGSRATYLDPFTIYGGS